VSTSIWRLLSLVLLLKGLAVCILMNCNTHELYPPLASLLMYYHPEAPTVSWLRYISQYSFGLECLLCAFMLNSFFVCFWNACHLIWSVPLFSWTEDLSSL
jgi:hypothetical protein